MARLAARAGGAGSALHGSIFASADLALGTSALELAARRGPRCWGIVLGFWVFLKL